MKKKVIVSILLASMTAGLFAGCGSSSQTTETNASDTKTEETASSDAAAEGEIEINFPCIWVGTDSKAEVFGQMVEAFNTEYDGTYQVNIEEQTDYDAYQDLIRTQISTGSAPDIFTVKTQADVEYYSSSGKCADLTEFLAGDIAANFVQGAVDNAKLDGVNYAVPYEMAYIPIMYNQKELDEAGTSVPTSFDELWQTNEALAASGVTPMCQMTGGGNAWTTMLWYSYALAATGGADVYSKDYTDEAYVKAAELIREMYQYTNSDAVGADASVVNGHFFNGDDAIYTNGTWILGRINSDEATYPDLYENLGLGSGLSYEGENGNAFISYCQAYIMVGAQEDEAKTEAIEAFLAYITDPEKVLELSNSSGSLFAMNIDASAMTNEKAAEAYALAQAADFIIPSFESQASTNVANAFPSLLEELILGDIDAAEFAQALADAE